MHAGRSWGGRPVRDDCPRSQRHRLGVVFASSHSTLKYTVYPPSQTYQQHALAGGGSGLWGSSCRPSRIGRRSGPVPVAYRLHERWRVVLFARRTQQARATVPWVAAQLQAHAQPVQLVRAFGRGPPPHAMAQYHRPVPPRTARPTRRAPCRSQAVRWSWPCAAAHSRALCRLRAGHVARVEHAEIARVHPWAAAYRPTAPGRRVALRADRRRRDRAAPAVRRGVGHAAGFGQGPLCALGTPRGRGCAPGVRHAPALALAAASLICKRVHAQVCVTLTLT